VELERLRRQDAGAFAELVRQHQQMVLGLGQSLGLRGADLDDAAAEAFAAVFRSIPRFQGKSELGTWVYRIAYRVIVKAREKRKRQRADELPDDAAAVSDRPGDAIEQDETAGAVWAAVEKLEVRQAAVVEMFYRRDWPIEKIATTMNCPVGTVKTLLFRARQRLKELLGGQELVP
jgi:RNA polymerase sigma-70 factor, ECF subfamily